jgi:hypothetical protein
MIELYSSKGLVDVLKESGAKEISEV